MTYLKLIELHATRTTVAAALLATIVQVLMIGTLFDQMSGGILV